MNRIIEIRAQKQAMCDVIGKRNGFRGTIWDLTPEQQTKFWKRRKFYFRQAFEKYQPIIKIAPPRHIIGEKREYGVVQIWANMKQPSNVSERIYRTPTCKYCGEELSYELMKDKQRDCCELCEEYISDVVDDLLHQDEEFEPLEITISPLPKKTVIKGSKANYKVR